MGEAIVELWDRRPIRKDAVGLVSHQCDDTEYITTHWVRVESLGKIMMARFFDLLSEIVRRYLELVPVACCELEEFPAPPKGVTSIGQSSLQRNGRFTNALPKATLIMESSAVEASSAGVNTPGCFLRPTLDDCSSQLSKCDTHSRSCYSSTPNIMPCQWNGRFVH